MREGGPRLLSLVPPKSLGGGCQKSILPSSSGFQKCRSPLKALLDEFTRFNTLAWWARPTPKNRQLRWFSHAGQFTQFLSIPRGGGRFGGRVARLATSQGLLHLSGGRARHGRAGYRRGPTAVPRVFSGYGRVQWVARAPARPRGTEFTPTLYSPSFTLHTHHPYLPYTLCNLIYPTH